MRRAHYAATRTPHKQRLVLGPLVFSIGIGMTVADVYGRAIANLEIEKITHDHPTFIHHDALRGQRVSLWRVWRRSQRQYFFISMRSRWFALFLVVM